MAISTRAEHLVSCGERVYAVGRELGDGTMLVVAKAAKLFGGPVSLVTAAALRVPREIEFAREGSSCITYSPYALRKGLPVDDAFDELLIVEMSEHSHKIMDALDAHIPLYKACWIVESLKRKQLSTYFELKHGLYKTYI
jgi:hypothetical protein